MKGNFTILFGDIVDFGQLIKSHGNNPEIIQSRHKSIINSAIEKFNGILLDNFNDSAKIIFKNPFNAIQYSIDVFQKFSMEPRIPYRIGISSGYIEYDNDGIYGEIAQIASRILQICPEGTVLMTEEVANKVNKDFSLVHIGRTFLKGINEPTEIFGLAGKGLYIPQQMELSDKSKNKNSIAVLPFINTSSENELDYICDGLAEEIIDRLTQSQDLNVIARSSSFLFKNRDASILEISRKLNVSYVLDGSIRKRNNEYRISYQLVDSTTGYNLLSNRISSDFNNLYDSERQITKDILRQFNIENTNISEDIDYYIDPNAYSYYLKGKHFAFQWTKETSQEAIRNYKMALEIVPNYSLAYAGLSMCYTHSAANRFIEPKYGFEQALLYADKAIQEDSNRHEGFIAKALVSFWIGNWYLPDLEKNLNKALQISPCNAEIRMFNGMQFLFKGDMDRAIIELKLAKSLDPYSIPVIIRLGLVQYLRRDYEDSYNTYLMLLDNSYYGSYSLMRLAWCCIQLKQFDRALKFLNEVKNDQAYYNMIYSSYLVIYYHLKNDEIFFKYKAKIEDQDESDITYYYNHAILNKLLNNPDKSIYYLEKTLEDNLLRMAFIQFDEFWNDYAEIPAFQKLVDNTCGDEPNHVIRLNSDTREFIELNMNDFLYAEAQDNYTLIVYKEKKTKHEIMLRATLSLIEAQLPVEDVFRCHRSYLVNMNTDFIYHRSDNKIFLFHPFFNITLPVSRANERKAKDLF